MVLKLIVYFLSATYFIACGIVYSVWSVKGLVKGRPIVLPSALGSLVYAWPTPALFVMVPYLSILNALPDGFFLFAFSLLGVVGFLWGFCLALMRSYSAVVVLGVPKKAYSTAIQRVFASKDISPTLYGEALQVIRTSADGFFHVHPFGAPGFRICYSKSQSNLSSIESLLRLIQSGQEVVRWPFFIYFVISVIMNLAGIVFFFWAIT